MKILRLGILALFIISACQDLSIEEPKTTGSILESIPEQEPIIMELPALERSARSRVAGPDVILATVEYLTAGENGIVGNMIVFTDSLIDTGNSIVPGEFVADNSPDGTSDVSFYIDNNRASTSLSVVITEDAIARAIQSWDAVFCSDLNMTQVEYDGRQTGRTAAIFSQFGFPFGGSFNYVADIVHAGWLPSLFFDLILPGSGQEILSATFTYFITENNVPVDSDGDGLLDVAWRETYYNDGFVWGDGSDFDVETVALHETGHGLSLSHSGNGFRDGDGTLIYEPRAVMNPAYLGILTSPQVLDRCTHCNIWSNWPAPPSDIDFCAISDTKKKKRGHCIGKGHLKGTGNHFGHDHDCDDQGDDDDDDHDDDDDDDDRNDQKKKDKKHRHKNNDD